MSKHLIRLAAPKSWSINRKRIKFITKPRAGPHNLKDSITITTILKDILKYAKTTREVKKILNSDSLLINERIRKDHRFPIGVMDVIAFPKTQEYFRVFYNKKGKFILHPIKKEESAITLYKIANKTILKGKKVQLNLCDGKNIIVKKDSYKVGDTIILSNNEVKSHLKFDKGALIYLTGGKHIGTIGVFEGIHEFTGSQATRIIFKTAKETSETLKEYAFVIGKDKQAISLPQNE